MKVPQEVANAVKAYEELNKHIEELSKQLDAHKKVFLDWEQKNTDSGVWIGDLWIVDKPSGDPQDGGEYCNQYCHGEDWFTGTYYYPIENSDEYVAYNYEC